MANRQISELTAATTPLDGTELLHVLQGANSRKATTANLPISSATQTALNAKAVTARTISASGLATGGGDLSADRTITVTGASQADAEAGTNDTKAMTPLRTAQAITALARPARGHIFGLLLSNGTGNNIIVSAGECASDAALPILMDHGSAVTKNFGATFAEGTGNGGFAAGESLPVSGSIHIWMMDKGDGTSDVMANNHATSGYTPTLPSGFTHKRRIGSLRTDGSGNIFAFTQSAFTPNQFILAVNMTAPANTIGLASVNITLQVPPNLIAMMNARLFKSAGAPVGFVRSLDQTDQAASISAGTADIATPGSGLHGNSSIERRVDSLSRVAARASEDGVTLNLGVCGWYDDRGAMA